MPSLRFPLRCTLAFLAVALVQPALAGPVLERFWKYPTDQVPG